MKSFCHKDERRMTLWCPESREDMQALLCSLDDQKGPLAFDTETTTHRRHHHTYTVCGFSVARGNMAIYVPLMHADGTLLERQSFLDTLEFMDYTREPIFMFNAKFDYHAMEAEDARLARQMQERVVDTQILAYLQNSVMATQGLKEICGGAPNPAGGRYKPAVGVWCRDFKEEVSLRRGAHRLAVEQIWKYAAADAWMTLALGNLLHPMFKDSPVLKLEHDVLWATYDMENSGARVDREYLKKAHTAVAGMVTRKRKKMDEVFGAAFNPKSPTSMRDAMAARGIQSFKKTKGRPYTASELQAAADAAVREYKSHQMARGEEWTEAEAARVADVARSVFKKQREGNDSWDKYVLAALAPQHPEIQLIQEYNKLFTLQNGFFKSLLKQTHLRQERVHCSYKTNVETGRMSCKSPNLQNTPRPDPDSADAVISKVRGSFVPDPGCVLLCCDFDQVELRLAGWYSKEPSIIEAARSGHDLHLATAATVNAWGYEDAAQRLADGDKQVKLARTQAKGKNFCILYGGTEHKLAGDLGLTREQAVALLEADRQGRPVLHRWIADVHAFVRKHGYVEDWFGRRRHFKHAPGIKQEWLLSRVYRQAVNFLPQGGSASVTKIALLRVADILRQYEGAYLTNVVHDELIINVPKKYVAELAPRIKAAMEDFPQLDGMITAGVDVAPVRWSEKVSLERWLRK